MPGGEPLVMERNPARATFPPFQAPSLPPSTGRGPDVGPNGLDGQPGRRLKPLALVALCLRMRKGAAPVVVVAEPVAVYTAEGGAVPLRDDGREHNVLVTLG